MTQTSVATPTQNYLESDDLVFEIGDEDIETKKRPNDDRVGYGVETEPEDDDIEVEDDDQLADDFEDFEWSDEEESE